MSPFAEDLAKKEYDRLSNELVSIQDEANQLARYAVVAAATICAVVATKAKVIAPSYLHFLKFMPAMIVILLGFRVLAQFARLMNISRYIQTEYEGKHFNDNSGFAGWETYLNGVVRHSDGKAGGFREKWSWFWKNPSGSVAIFWGVLLLLSIAFIFI